MEHDTTAEVPDLLDEAAVGALLEAGDAAASGALLPRIKREIDLAVYADRGRAERLADAAERAAGRLGDPVSRAFAEASRARVLFAAGRYAEAEPRYAAAAAALDANGRPVDAAALAKQRIETLSFLGRHVEAFALARGARRVLKRSGDRRLLAEHETNVGNLHYHVDRHVSALGCYARARAIFAELGDDLALAHIDRNRGEVLFELGRLDESREHFERAARSYRDLGVAVRAVQVDLAIAYSEYARGHYREALRRFAAARAEGDGTVNVVDAALTDLDLAEVYLRMNARAEAREAADRAAASFAVAGMPREVGAARRVAASVRLAEGDAARAVEDLEGVVAAFDAAGHAVQSHCARLDLAEAHLAAGTWDRAATEARLAAEGLARTPLAARRRYARLLDGRAALGAGRPSEALRAAQSCLRSATCRESEWLRYSANRLAAEAYAATGAREAALAAYREAIETVEAMRSRIGVDEFKSSFLEDKLGLYEGAVALCLAEGTIDGAREALRVLELSKSRSLTDLLLGYLDEEIPGGAAGSSARERFRQLVDELAARTGRRERDGGGGGARRGRRREAETASLETEVTEAFRALQIEDVRFADLRRPSIVDPDDLCSLLGEDDALVEFATSGGEVSAVVATRGGIEAARGVARLDRVGELLDGLRFQLSTFAYGRELHGDKTAHLRRRADAYLGALYDELLRPLEPLVGDRDLVVVPHGRLHYVPFHALFDGSRYIVERRAVSTAPSATLFALCATAPAGRGGPALVCGVSDASVPEIAREIAALKGLFPDARVLEGADATRENVRRFAESCGVLHLASHARFRADNPLLSSVSLADGDLTFYDVFSLRLSADLVVLSGCATGTVAVGAGDELHGLMRGFLYAGAPSLVISLWDADDAATADLMTSFYAAWRGGATKRDALRSAQRAVLERYGHPYYWAPFSLIGRHT